MHGTGKRTDGHTERRTAAVNSLCPTIWGGAKGFWQANTAHIQSRFRARKRLIELSEMIRIMFFYGSRPTGEVNPLGGH